MRTGEEERVSTPVRRAPGWANPRSFLSKRGRAPPVSYTHLDRERQVILLRYYKGLTQDRAARVLGVSQVQVSRIERKAVEHLRHKLDGP